MMKGYSDTINEGFNRDHDNTNEWIIENEKDELGQKTTEVCENHEINYQAPLSYVWIRGLKMFSLRIDNEERVCLSQISNTLLKKFTYNEIHNRRVALGINCLQCSPLQLEVLRKYGAMASSSRRCGMITRKEAERLVRSFLDESRPPALPDNFSFTVEHKCDFGCQGRIFIRFSQGV